MKKIIYFILVIGMMMGCALQVRANTEKGQTTSMEYIFIKKKPGTIPGAPRDLSTAIVEAEFIESTSSVVVSLQNVGTTVGIQIENLSTNEVFSDTVSGSGVAVLPISGTSGVWLLTISLENGDVYVGEFEL